MKILNKCHYNDAPCNVAYHKDAVHKLLREVYKQFGFDHSDDIKRWKKKQREVLDEIKQVLDDTENQW